MQSLAYCQQQSWGRLLVSLACHGRCMALRLPSAEEGSVLQQDVDGAYKCKQQHPISPDW